jgi:phasin
MTTQTKGPKAGKNGTASSTNPFDVFTFSVPSIEIPSSFREFAEKSVAQARDTYAKLKSAAEDATDMVEGSFETAREGAFTLGVKALDAAKNNTDASFAFARDLFGAKTVSEVIELQTAYTRKVFDAAASQFKDFQELTQKFVTDATRPVTEQVEKTFREIKAA